MPSLVWLRSDLRTADNTALHHAAQTAEAPIVAAFAITPGQWHAHDWGPPKVDFVLRNVAVLADDLARLEIPLRIIHADTFEELPGRLLDLARDIGAAELLFNREYEVNEAARDEAVTRAFEDAGLAVHAFHDQTLIPPNAPRTTTGNYYSVFTPFRKAWIRHLEERGNPTPLPEPRGQKPIDIDADPVPAEASGFAPSEVRADLWPAGQNHALERLRGFTDAAIDGYKDQRDTPALDATSCLSPYLAAGVVSPRQCLAAALEANSGAIESDDRPGPTTWITQLIWREFYRHILVGFPRVSMNQPFKTATRDLEWNDDPDRFDRWAAGRTGVPIVDAAMRQLRATGWMHNRLRMIAAMYLTKNLFVDWRRGERHFMQHLVDGDLANNNGGWQWAASTGTDAAPYFRIFNPVTQSRRFDPDGAFIRRYCPELDQLDTKDIHDPSALPPLRRSTLDYPEPMVDLAESRKEAIDAFKALSA